MPLRDKPVQDIWDYEGGDNTAFFNSAGNLEAQVADVITNTYDKVTLDPLGVAIRQAVSQLIDEVEIRSTGWVAHSGATITNQALNVFGQFRGLLIESAGGADDAAKLSNSFSLTSGTDYVFAVLVRDDDADGLRVLFDPDSSGTNSFLTTSSFASAPTAADESEGTLTDITWTLLSDSSTYLLTGVFTPNSTDDFNLRIGPNSSSSGEGVIGLAANVYEAGSYQGFTLDQSTTVADVLTSDFNNEPYRGGVQVDVDYQADGFTEGQVLFQLDDGSEDNKIAVISKSTGEAQLVVTVSTSNTTADSTIDLVNGSAVQVYASLTDITISVDGETAVSTSVSDFPFNALTTLRAGSDSSDSNQLGGTIERIRLTPVYVEDFGDFLLEDGTDKLLFEDGSIFQLG